VGGLRRRHPLVLLGLVLAVFATALAVLATVDHRRKQDDLDAASVTAWFCANRGQMCGHRSPREIERRWIARERWYKAGAAALLLAAPIGLIVVAPRSRTRRSA
jgi:hypothetical protein